MVTQAFLVSMAEILHTLIMAYIFVIIIGAVLSFINPDPYNKFVQIIYRLTEPVYSFIKRYIPTAFGGIDFAPLIVLLILQFLDKFFINLVLSYASKM